MKKDGVRMKSIEERRKLMDEYRRVYKRSLQVHHCVICHFYPNLKKGDYKGARRLIFGMAMGRHITAKHFRIRFDEAYEER